MTRQAMFIWSIEVLPAASPEIAKRMISPITAASSIPTA